MRPELVTSILGITVVIAALSLGLLDIAVGSALVVICSINLWRSPAPPGSWNKAKYVDAAVAMLVGGYGFLSWPECALVASLRDDLFEWYMVGVAWLSVVDLSFVLYRWLPRDDDRPSEVMLGGCDIMMPKCLFSKKMHHTNRYHDRLLECEWLKCHHPQGCVESLHRSV